MSDPIIIEPAGQPLGTIVFLHGLGASGDDFAPLAQQLMPVLPVRWVLPHAPLMPVTINGGYRMPAWYDLLSLERADGFDPATVVRSREGIRKLLEAEAAQSPRHLLLGGFSQGGAMSLATAFDAPVALSGVIVLSGYLLQKGSEVKLPAAAGEGSPPFFMGHGVVDDVLPLQLAQQSRDALRAAGVPLEWHEYPMGHSVCPKEVEDLVSWLSKIMG